MCGAVRRSGGAAVIIGNPARSVGPAGYQYEDSVRETHYGILRVGVEARRADVMVSPG